MIWKVKKVLPSPSLLDAPMDAAAVAAPPPCARSSMRMGWTSWTTPGRSSRRYLGGFVDSSVRRLDTSEAMALAELVGEEQLSATTAGELEGENDEAGAGPIGS